ncbi:unnamed protein product, partial [Allacma fusca]
MIFSLQTVYKGILISLFIQSVCSQFEGEDLIFEAGSLGKLKGRAARTYKLNRPFIELLGIPYVEPPTDENRFLPAKPVSHPLPPTDGNGNFDATKYGACCPQATSSANLACAFKLNEDCLRLNIYTPL